MAESSEEILQRAYNCTLGTDYYLIGRKNELRPITFNISYNGNTFTFIPSETISDTTVGLCTTKVEDNSLLRGIAKIMAYASNYYL